MDCRGCWLLRAMKVVVLFGLITSIDATISLPWGPSIIPRTGRSSPMMLRDAGSWGQHPVPDCCPAGMKAQMSLNYYGETVLSFFCPKEFSCCDGLDEFIGESQDGRIYSACTPQNIRIEDFGLRRSQLYPAGRRKQRNIHDIV